MKENNLLEELTFFDLSYLRAKDDGRGIKRGDIFIFHRKIPHYPQIGRILTLKQGILRNFKKDQFFVEEKFDGYNVRVFSHNGRLLAATRGGIICPFSTDKLLYYQDILQSFFGEYPDSILVGELVGMNNPYMDAPTHYELKKDVEIRFFDIMNANGEFFLPEEKYELFDKFEIPSVNIFGRFSSSDEDYEKLREIILTLNEAGREGIVLKSSKIRGKYLKFVTPFINLMDIEQDAFLMPELPGNFYTSRIIRYVIASYELGVNVHDEEKYVGKSLLNGIKKALKFYIENGYVAKRFEIRFINKDNAMEFLKVYRRVAKHVRLKDVNLIEKDGTYTLSFWKVFIDSTEKFRDFLTGKHLYD